MKTRICTPKHCVLPTAFKVSSNTILTLRVLPIKSSQDVQQLIDAFLMLKYELKHHCKACQTEHCRSQETQIVKASEHLFLHIVQPEALADRTCLRVKINDSLRLKTDQKDLRYQACCVVCHRNQTTFKRVSGIKWIFNDAIASPVRDWPEQIPNVVMYKLDV